MLGTSSGQSFPSLNFPRQQRPETTRDSTELRTPVPDGGGGGALGEGSAGLWNKPEQTVLSANRHVLFVLFCLQAHGHRPSQQHILAFPLKVPAAWLGCWGEADSSSWVSTEPRESVVWPATEGCKGCPGEAVDRTQVLPPAPTKMPTEKTVKELL